jgi:hypothetical protein
MRKNWAIVFALELLVSCNSSEGIPRSDKKDVMKYAGIYKGHARDCSSCTCELLLEPTFNKNRIYIENVGFGDGMCRAMRKVYGYVKNDTLIFPKREYTDHCIGEYRYDATATLRGDTLLFVFNFDGYFPWHDTIMYMKK